MEKKIKQHYVFQAYLSQWCVSNQLFTLKYNKIYRRGTNAVGYEKHFYRIPRLNNLELNYLNKLLDRHSSKIANKIKSNIMQTQEHFESNDSLSSCEELLVKDINSNSLISEEELHSEFSKIIKTNDIIANNVYEDFLSDIEKQFPLWLRKLSNIDLSFYNSETLTNLNQKYNFNLFVSIQYFRTKAVKERVKQTILTWNKEWMLTNPHSKNFLNNVNIDNILFYLTWYYQEIFAQALTTDNFKVTLLLNNTNISFITSDQPVVNLKTDYNNLFQEAKEVLLYYPITPTIGLLISDIIVSKTIEVSEQEVLYYNDFIANASYEQVFSDRSESLTRYIK